jgi:hypothetical protein
MPSRKRKSPRKNSGTGPDYYGTDGDQDRQEITSRKASAKPPSNKRRRTGYKEPLTKRTPLARKNSSESSSESLAFEEESESDDGDEGLLIDINNKNKRWWQLVWGGPTMMRILMRLTPTKLVHN